MKKRLDVLLTERGLRESRQQAQAAIMRGLVTVNGRRIDKAGTQVPEEAEISVREEAFSYVSRGGLKLRKALEVFPISLRNAVCADIGASTGGFTDCCLQNGAAKVYAVDVGYGQLAWKLRTDPRVICLERTNARYLSAEQIPEPLDFFSADVSFISLKWILPPMRALIRDGGRALCLIKPQFEAGREQVGKRGVVRDKAVHREVLERFFQHAARSGFAVEGLSWSPIRGPEGNIEYLGFLRPEAEVSRQDGEIPRRDAEISQAFQHTDGTSFDLPALVEQSHRALPEKGTEEPALSGEERRA